MIYINTGKTGSGKTFRMMNDVYKRWLSGEDIYSNTVLNFVNYGGQSGVNIEDEPLAFSLGERIFYKIKKSICEIIHKDYYIPARGNIEYFEDINEILEVREGVIVFDEAQTLFNARKWENLPEEFQYKLQQHRKHHLDLYATAQNMGTVDITYRRLVQFWVHHERIFGIQRKGLELIAFFRAKVKDIDYLYNSVDDLQVPDLKVKMFLIHKFKKRLYDTFYDIGFKRFKTVWINNFDKNMNLKQTYLILPKKLLLKDALRDIRLYHSLSEPDKLQNSRKNWKYYAAST